MTSNNLHDSTFPSNSCSREYNTIYWKIFFYFFFFIHHSAGWQFEMISWKFRLMGNARLEYILSLRARISLHFAYAYFIKHIFLLNILNFICIIKANENFSSITFCNCLPEFLSKFVSIHHVK